MRRVMGPMAVAVLLVVVAAGCGSDGSDGSDGAASPTTTTTASGATEPAAVLTTDALDGRTFLSQQVEGRELVQGSTLSLSFDGTNLAANAGCNTMTGAYALKDDRIRWTDTPAATMMACEQDLMVQDQQIVQLLKGGMEAALDGNELVLTSGTITITLLDKAAAEPDQPLVGTTWTLESTTDGDAVSSIPSDVKPPTLTIDASGRSSVFAGCNRGGGGVTVSDDGASVTFEPMALTRMACSGGAGEVEAAVTAVLDGEVQVVIDGDALSLRKGTKALGFRAA